MRFFQSWWSRTYNRPLKDPILASYTVEELAYEYFDHKERDAYAAEKQDEEADKIEETKLEEADKWAEEEEKKDAELEAAKVPSADESVAPPEDEAWMREQLNRDKELHGETFGSDIAEEF
jgi:hypothetical protein